MNAEAPGDEGSEPAPDLETLLAQSGAREAMLVNMISAIVRRSGGTLTLRAEELAAVADCVFNSEKTKGEPFEVVLTVRRVSAEQGEEERRRIIAPGYNNG